MTNERAKDIMVDVLEGSKSHFHDYLLTGGEYDSVMDEWIEALNIAIKAIEEQGLIVRCGECIYHKRGKCTRLGHPFLTPKDDFYCKSGIKRKDDNND